MATEGTVGTVGTGGWMAQVEVVVRLSRTGSAMAQPGDWEWRSAIVDIESLDAPLKLEALLRAPNPASG